MKQQQDNLPASYSLRDVRIVCIVTTCQALLFGGAAATAARAVIVRNINLTPKEFAGLLIVSALACVHIAIAAWVLVRPHHRYQAAAKLAIGSPLLIPSVAMIVALPVAIVLHFL